MLDVRDPEATRALIEATAPEVVFHLAAQPLVLESYRDPIGTFATNVMGTANVLHAAALGDTARVVLVVTSDKVYANDETGRAFVEDDRLGGRDPYAASKAAAEIVAAAFRGAAGRSDMRVVTARGGNVIGGGDRAADRLLPDLFRAIAASKPLVIRHPEATRPWQHVLDVISGYMAYASAALDRSDLPPSLNFGPVPGSEVPVGDVIERMVQLWGQGEWRVEPGAGQLEHKRLTIDPAKAAEVLGWTAAVDLDEALRLTYEWDHNELGGADLFEVLDSQLDAFSAR
jgi:CDP-glucose 4,6-dehydratase